MTTYLDLGQFSRFVIAVIDRQIHDIDGGRWHWPPTPRAPRGSVPMLKTRDE
jgi:hypothetical protein